MRHHGGYGVYSSLQQHLFSTEALLLHQWERYQELILLNSLIASSSTSHDRFPKSKGNNKC